MRIARKSKTKTTTRPKSKARTVPKPTASGSRSGATKRAKRFGDKAVKPPFVSTNCHAEDVRTVPAGHDGSSGQPIAIHGSDSELEESGLLVFMDNAPNESLEKGLFAPGFQKFSPVPSEAPVRPPKPSYELYSGSPVDKTMPDHVTELSATLSSPTSCSRQSGVTVAPFPDVVSETSLGPAKQGAKSTLSSGSSAFPSSRTRNVDPTTPTVTKAARRQAIVDRRAVDRFDVLTDRALNILLVGLGKDDPSYLQRVDYFRDKVFRQVGDLIRELEFHRRNLEIAEAGVGQLMSSRGVAGGPSG